MAALLRILHPNVDDFILTTGVDIKFKNMVYPVLIAATHVPELCSIKKKEDGIEFGGSVTLNQMQSVLYESVKELPGMVVISV